MEILLYRTDSRIFELYVEHSLVNIHEIFQNINHVHLLNILRRGVGRFHIPYCCLIFQIAPCKVFFVIVTDI